MLDTVFNILKISVVVAVAAAFMVAINALLGVLGTVLFGNVIGEVLAIVSACLPFNALAVFGALGVACSAILAFLIAKKIFDLTSWSISTV